MAILTMLRFPTASFHVCSFTETPKGQESYSVLVTVSQWPTFPHHLAPILSLPFFHIAEHLRIP